MSGSLAIISKRVGLDRAFSGGEAPAAGGGDIGFRRPAVSIELNFVNPPDAKASSLGEWPLTEVATKSMTGDRLPGENRIRKGEPGGRAWVGSGRCGGGGLEAGQHQESSSGGETTGGPGLGGRSAVEEGWGAVEMVVSRHLRRLGLVGGFWSLS